MADQDPRSRRARALLIGVSAYDHTGYPDGVPSQLPAVRHNVDRLRQALTRGGAFDPEDVTVCDSPDQGQFQNAVHELSKDDADILLLYFAGHGAIPSAPNELFLQMRNARVVAGGQAVFPGGQQFGELLGILAPSRARHIVVILDCCFAGNAARVWQAFDDNRRVLLLMSVQPNHRTDAGAADTPTPFTAELVSLLEEHEGLRFSDLSDLLRARMRAAGHRTLRDEIWKPLTCHESDVDVQLTTAADKDPTETETGGVGPAPTVGPTPVVEKDSDPPPTPPPSPTPHPPLWRRLLDSLSAVLCHDPTHRALLGASALLIAAALALAANALVDSPDEPAAACAPPLELRVLTDPDLEPTVRRIADAYLTDPANTDDGCRRSGVTVYSAGAADAVDGLRRQTGTWQEPRGDTVNPQRDVGPQPDIWIPGTRAAAERVTRGQDTDAVATLKADEDPFAYSPIVLAVPEKLAAGGLGDRSGPALDQMFDTLGERHPGAEVRRSDPEFTDTGLLATVGLYGAPDDGGSPSGTERRDPARAEARVAQSTPPSPTAAELLCTLPDDDAVDERTAALVPEFLMRSGLGCDSVRRTPRSALYPGDVPGLEPVFVRVRWRGADRDTADRDRAANEFRAWLTGAGGRAVLARDGFRSAADDRALLATDDVPPSLLGTPEPLTESAGRDAMDAALADYRKVGGPGRVLFLLDSSGSMADRWEGPSGGPGLLKQSLGGLGAADEYALWSVAGLGSGPETYRTLLPLGRHTRGDAERALDRAQVRDTEADPPGALLAALEAMERRGDDDARPDLIVHVTDGEDSGRLSGDQLADVLDLARASDIPVTTVSLQGGGCDAGRPEARVAAASGGRCLDADDDLGPALHDEVARTGTGRE